MASFEKQVFKQGSTTYFNSSLFFSKDKLTEVEKLYSFVRVIDNYVDQTPQDRKSFELIVSAANNHPANLNEEQKQILENINYISDKYDPNKELFNAFIKSMQMDLDGKIYNSLEDTLEYIYGSAEVIGLYMSRILGVNSRSDEFAKLQGRAMQYINFIRDIAEDNSINRQYFANDILSRYGLSDLSKESAQIGDFKSFIRNEINRYEQWQKESYKGYRDIPYRQRIAVKTASDMYNWTASKIYKDPYIVYVKIVKPSRNKVYLAGVKNIFRCIFYI